MTVKKDPKNLIRNKEAKSVDLIGGVGKVIAESGFDALNAVSVSAAAGLLRGRVSGIFGNLNTLIKAYVAREDYWGVFFERFQLSGSATDEEIKAMFVEMMQENLCHFWKSREVQQLILAQISGKRKALMRSISEGREQSGAALLKLTDRHFAGTSVDFRTHISLMLGGTYYLVLHAKENGSTVAGRDLSLDRDFLSLHRSITQYIDWAWQHAHHDNNNQNQQTTNMNYEFEYLEELAEKLAKAGKDLVDTEADPELKAEVKKQGAVMKKNLQNIGFLSQTQTYLHINMHTLVAICDLLYDPSSSANPNAQVLLDLLDAIRQSVKEQIPANLSIPRLFKDRESKVLEQQWKGIAAELLVLGIREELITLVGLPFLRFINPESKLEWADFKFLHKYEMRLKLNLEETDMDEEKLMQSLIALGYNHTRFTSFYASLIKERIAGHTDQESRKILVRERATLKQITVYTQMKYDRYKLAVVDELNKWTEAEIEARSSA